MIILCIKNFIKHILLISSQLLFIILLVDAGNKGIGTTGAQFLTIGVGARPLGMGGAFCAVADDVNALYWNPAGLDQINKFEATFMYNKWLEDIHFNYLAGVIPIRKWGTFGLAGTLLTMADMNITDNAHSDGTGKTFGAYDFAIQLSYGKKIISSLYSGLNIKYIYQKIEDVSRRGIIIDLGLLYTSVIEDLNIGVFIQNIGILEPFINNVDNLPMHFKLGSSYKFSLFRKNFLYSLDINLSVYNNIYISSGLECQLLRMLALRTGYIFNINSNEIPGFSDLNFGIGLNYKQFRLDYAMRPNWGINMVHIISFSILY